MPPSSPSYRCFLALTISSSLLFLSSQRQVLGCLPIVTVSLPQIISWRPGIPTYLGCRNLNQTFLVQRQRPSGFDYGGGGGGLKPQFNRGKPGGAKTTTKNPNSFSVVGNSFKQGGEAGEVVGQQAAVYKIQVAPAPKRKREDEDYDANWISLLANPI